MPVSFSPNWKILEGAKTVHKLCPRCHNEVDFQLVYEKVGIMFFTVLVMPTKTIFALHCPICIQVEDVSKEIVAKLRA